MRRLAIVSRHHQSRSFSVLYIRSITGYLRREVKMRDLNLFLLTNLAFALLVTSIADRAMDTSNATITAFIFNGSSGGGRDGFDLIGDDLMEVEFLVDSESSRRMMLLGAGQDGYKTDRSLVKAAAAGCGRNLKGKPYTPCTTSSTSVDPGQGCGQYKRGHPCQG